MTNKLWLCLHFCSTQKAIQDTDLPVKILKQNSDIFGTYTCDFLGDCLDEENVPSILKRAQKEVPKG